MGVIAVALASLLFLAPGDADAVVITDAGLDVLAERRAELTPGQAARLDLALASPRRAA